MSGGGFMKKSAAALALLIFITGLIISCGGNGSSGGKAETKGNFIAVGEGKNILISPDGINWHTRSTTGIDHFNGIANGNNIFVAWETTRSLSANLLSSPDAKHWTLRSSNTFPYPLAMIYANGIFVAVCSFGVVLTSPDGMNWTNSATLRSGSDTDALQAIAFGGGSFVTVSAFGNIWHSPDGINWTVVQGSFPALNAVTYGNGIFVAAGGNEIFTSSDGVNWTGDTLNLFPILDILSLAQGNNTFVAVGIRTEFQGTQPVSTLVLLHSSDGINWTGELSTIDVSVNRLNFARELFFLTGINGTILTSPDGITWTHRESGSTEFILSVITG